VSANGRCDIHELLRQYAIEQLSPHEREQAHERHCAYYAEFLHQRWEHLKGKHQKRALEEIEVEIDNVRASWLWATTHQCSEFIDKSMDSVWFFYNTRCLYQEGSQAFQIAVESVAYQGKSLTLGRLLAHQGGFYFSLTQPVRARSLLEESLLILRQHDADREVGLALLRLSGVLMFHENNPMDAKGCLQESLLLFQRDDDSWGTVYAVRWLGFAALLSEEYEEANRLSLETLAIYQERQDQAGIAIALSLVGLSALGLGDYYEAKRAGQESVALCREIGLKWAALQGLVSIAGATCALGEYQDSTQYFYDALLEAVEYQIITYTVWILLETVPLWIARHKPEWALAILAFSLQFPIPPQGKPAALRHLVQLEAELPADLVKTAKARGQSRDLDAIVQEVLAELKATQAAALIVHTTPTQASVDPLTERELEVLHLIAEGMSNQQIAAKLILAIGTVKFYASQIYSKLQVENRIQALARARELNLLS
jgi:DNA-binding CsgD family transcriptional regulator